MKTRFLCISGKLRHGKDTFADYLIDHLNLKDPLLRIKKLSFSNPIKKAVHVIFPQLTENDLWGPSQNRSKIINGYINPKTKQPLQVRDCLTAIGSLGRSFNLNFWANAAVQEAKDIIEKYEHNFVIITDCRYQNEKKVVEDNGGLVIRVIRPDVGFTTNDPSEVDLDDVPLEDYYAVINNSSLTALNDQAAELVSKLEL